MAKKPIVPTGNAGARPSRPTPPPLQVMMKRADAATALPRPRDVERIVVPKAIDRKKD